MKRHAAITSAFAGALALAACSGEDEEALQEESKGALTKEQNSDVMKRIDCAIGEGSSYGPDCYIEKAFSDGKEIFIVHQPGGGFRRFIRLKDGRGLITADGADEAELTRDGDEIVVQVAEDRYRFPALPPQQSAASDGAGEGSGTAAQAAQAGAAAGDETVDNQAAE